MAGRGPPVVHLASEGLAARRLVYAQILLEEGGVNLQTVKPEELIFRMASPYEARGITSADIEKWVTDCDSQKDPAGCLRARAQAALRPSPGLGTKLLVIGAVCFLGSYAATKWL